MYVCMLHVKRYSICLCFVLAGACATRRPGAPLTPGFNTFTPEHDVQLGQQAAAQVRRQVEVVQLPDVKRYLVALGSRLASHSAAGGYPYSFTMIRDDSINAFALPGGPIFVHTGLIRAADNEGQVAGVLAHEIGHVALRHATSQVSKANLVQIPAILAGAVIGSDSAAAQAARLGVDLGLNSVLLKYSRDAERQSDAFGAQLMALAGYNPLEMAHFFEKLESEGGGRAPEFLSSHPNPGNRVAAVQAEVAALPRTSFQAGTGDFAQVKQIVSQLPASARRR